MRYRKYADQYKLASENDGFSLDCLFVGSRCSNALLQLHFYGNRQPMWNQPVDLTALDIGCLSEGSLHNSSCRRMAVTSGQVSNWRNLYYYLSLSQSFHSAGVSIADATGELESLSGTTAKSKKMKEHALRRASATCAISATVSLSTILLIQHRPGTKPSTEWRWSVLSLSPSF